MDAIWVYINSGNQGELQESLRLAKNFKHDREIVVGDKPLFETTAEHWKPPITRWSMISPHHDVINKLYYITAQDISDDFILMNDDFFVLEPTEIKNFHRGTLDEHIAGRVRNDAYTKSLVKTRDYLKALGIENPLSYELHTPFVYNKQKLNNMYEGIMHLIKHSGPMLSRSLYGNIYEIGGKKMNDVKNPEDYRGRVFLSTNELTFSGEIGNYIRASA